MRRTLFSVIPALALTTGIARADVITTFMMSNVSTGNGATITGSFKIDQTTYNEMTDAGFDGGTLNVAGEPSFSIELDGTYSFVQYVGNDIIFVNPSPAEMDLPIGSPPATNATIDLSGITFANPTLEQMDTISQGSLVATTPAAVPEPPPVTVLGAGLLGLGLLWWRRRRKHHPSGWYRPSGTQ